MTVLLEEDYGDQGGGGGRGRNQELMRLQYLLTLVGEVIYSSVYQDIDNEVVDVLGHMTMTMASENAKKVANEHGFINYKESQQD